MGAPTVIKRIFHIAIVFVIAGCNPYQYGMGDKHFIKCEIISGLHTVEHSSNESLIKDGGILDLCYFAVTEHSISLNTKLESGDGFQVLLRPIVMHGFIKDSGLVMSFTKHGVAVDSNGRTIIERKYPSVSDGAVIRLYIRSDNTFTQVVYGCDTIYKSSFSKIESDDIVIRTLPQSELRIADPEWDAVASSDE